MKKIYILLFVASIVTNCNKKTKKDDVPTPEPPKGTVEVVFVPKRSANSFQMNTNIVTPAGETVKITKWKFFLSNIGLSKADASENPAIPTDANKAGTYLIDFGAPNFTINATNNAYKISFNALTGDYNDIRFNVGVPREVNHGDPTTAAFPLDLSQEDMYWSWNSGYIFMLLEGEGTAVATFNDKFHFGVGGDNRLMSFFFGNMLNSIPKFSVKENQVTRITIEVDLDEILTNRDGSHYSFGSQASADVHGGQYADKIRDNASAAFNYINAQVIQ